MMDSRDRDAAFRRVKAEAERDHEGAFGRCSSPTCLSCDCVDRRLHEARRDKRLRVGVERIFADYNRSERSDVTSGWWHYRLARLLSEVD